MSNSPPAAFPPGPSVTTPSIISPGTNLTLAEIGACNRAAQLDGTLYGTAAGFLGGLFGFRFLKLNKNISLFSGIATGVISGYVVSRQALTTRIARAEMDKAKAAEDSTTLKDRDVLWDMNRGEGGVAGMEHLEDKYATTRGDH
ncbi:hypothetical protein P389DRAFT_165117 [Cystobasidium minutum MCA 4210]|uniref:uncharacterized protein n=1 Tax=Cystobasidium minutum MCA 4210 TaxID=1397322 RepID=UPI0034CFF03B|eukprot:jgi/Rhomi1/165117/fgenesh1_kg.1_\